MPESTVHPLESILRLIAAAAPEPFYPGTYAKETGTARESLDPFLEQLRMAGLVHLTDWVTGHGQGYALTSAGEDILKNPRQLARLAAGKWSLSVVRSENRRQMTGPSPWERGEAVREALLYPVQPVVTFVVIAICVVLFLIKIQFIAQYREILDWAIASPVGLLVGQWWRLLTTAFLHGDILHIGFNMYALYALGQNAERIWGHWRYLTIFLVAAWSGSCLALSIQPVPCIGASGAVCGIFAAEAAWVYYNRQFLDPRLFFSWQRNFMINVVLIGLVSFMPNVSWAAHLGGAIAGLVMALWLSYFQLQVGWRRWLTPVGIILIPLVSFGLLVRTMNTSAAWEEIRIEEVYLPHVRGLERQSMQLVQDLKLDSIVGQDAKKRDSKKVEEAIQGLSIATSILDTAADELRRAGPFRTSSIEVARKVRLKDLETRIKLWQLGKECLEQGAQWTKEDEERLRQQAEEMKRADREWQALLR